MPPSLAPERTLPDVRQQRETLQKIDAATEVLKKELSHQAKTNTSRVSLDLYELLFSLGQNDMIETLLSLEKQDLHYEIARILDNQWSNLSEAARQRAGEWVLAEKNLPLLEKVSPSYDFLIRLAKGTRNEELEAALAENKPKKTFSPEDRITLHEILKTLPLREFVKTGGLELLAEHEPEHALWFLMNRKRYCQENQRSYRRTFRILSATAAENIIRDHFLTLVIGTADQPALYPDQIFREEVVAGLLQRTEDWAQSLATEMLQSFDGSYIRNDTLVKQCLRGGRSDFVFTYFKNGLKGMSKPSPEFQHSLRMYAADLYPAISPEQNAELLSLIIRKRHQISEPSHLINLFLPDSLEGLEKVQSLLTPLLTELTHQSLIVQALLMILFPDSPEVKRQQIELANTLKNPEIRQNIISLFHVGKHYLVKQFLFPYQKTKSLIPGLRRGFRIQHSILNDEASLQILNSLETMEKSLSELIDGASEQLSKLSYPELDFLSLIPSSVLHAQAHSLSHRQAFSWEKTGSSGRVTNFGGVENTISSECALLWKQVHECNIPCAPYRGEAQLSNNTTRVRSRYCGLSLASLEDFDSELPKSFLSELERQRLLILFALSAHGLDHGHPHRGNFTVEFVKKSLFEKWKQKINDIPVSKDTHVFSFEEYLQDPDSYQIIVRLIDFDAIHHV